MAEATVHEMPKSATEFLERMRSYKLGPARPFHDFATMDAMDSYMAQARCLSIALATAQEQDEFDSLNSEIKSGALRCLSTLLELALFCRDEETRA